MTDFSRAPDVVLQENLDLGFVGVQFQQGVPILDRDLNLLQDMIASSVRSIVTRYLGSGVPHGSDAFLVVPAGRDHDVVVTAGPVLPGVCMVDGVEATITADRAWSEQPGVGPDPWLPPASGSRTDTVYLDVTLETVEGEEVPPNEDIGTATTVRQRPAWTARVAEGGPAPAPGPGHRHFELARVVRTHDEPRITDASVTDVRRTLLTLPEIGGLVLPPQIVRLSAPSGGPGLTVTVHGSGLHFPGLSVTIGGVPADPVVLQSPTEITCTVPQVADEATSLVVSTVYGSARTDFLVAEV